MLKLLIAGIDRTAWLAMGYSIDIEKVLSTETMHLAILDLDSTAAALRIPEGSDIVLTRTDYDGDDIELLFGGEVANVIDEPIIDDTGTVTRIRCRDRMWLADQVFMPPRTYAEAPAREIFTAIVEEYLGPKGVFVISDPTGGPFLPELRIDDPITSVRQTLDRITLNCGWPWRINGEFAAGIIEPGELNGPATLADDGQSVLSDPPLRWEKQILTGGTRIFVQTAIPEFGPGPVEHTEEWIADGVQGVYPVHVLPTEIRASAVADTEAFGTSLEVTGLPRDMSIRLGARLSIDWHTTIYTITSGVVTDADGIATVDLDEILERDVPEGHPVTFLPGSFEQLELDDVVTPLDGAPYVWEPIENAIVYPGGAFTAGVVVRRRTWILHPTYVREWSPVAQQAIGWFDYAGVIDQRIPEEEGHTDIEGARLFAQAELAKRLSPPKRVTCTTQIPGHYPLLMVPMNFPDRLVVGPYLVTETRIRHTNINENGEILGDLHSQPLFYELVLWEGDSLGESFVQYFRGRNPSQGIRWGAATTVTLCVGEVPATVILDEDFSPGAADAFSASGPAYTWEKDIDGPDASYPGLWMTRDVAINTGGGPGGENYVTLNPGAAADQWVDCAVVWKGLGSVEVFGPSPGAWDASRGFLQIAHRFTADAMAEALSPLLFQVLGAWGYECQLQMYSTADPYSSPLSTGSHVGFELQYGLGTGSGFGVPAGGFVEMEQSTTTVPVATLLAEGWQTWTICWQCGTYVWSGSGDPTVASDGWFKVMRGPIAMFNLTNIPLVISDGTFTSAGNDHANHAHIVALGWDGLTGDSTNVTLRCDGIVSESVPAVVQYGAIEGVGDNTDPTDFTFDNDVVDGNTILALVTVYNYDSAQPGTVTDSQANTYSLEHQSGTAGEEAVRIYKTTATADGPLTITYTPVVSEWVTVGGVEVEGETVVNQQAGQSTSPAGTTHVAGMAATTVANCRVFGVIANSGGDSTLTPGAGWTQLLLIDPISNQAMLGLITKVALAAGTHDPTWSSATSSNSYHPTGIALERA